MSLNYEDIQILNRMRILSLLRSICDGRRPCEYLVDYSFQTKIVWNLRIYTRNHLDDLGLFNDLWWWRWPWFNIRTTFFSDLGWWTTLAQHLDDLQSTVRSTVDQAVTLEDHCWSRSSTRSSNRSPSQITVNTVCFVDYWHPQGLHKRRSWFRSMLASIIGTWNSYGNDWGHPQGRPQGRPTMTQNSDLEVGRPFSDFG